jgi:tRNA (mo5U34)-methyltransferase
MNQDEIKERIATKEWYHSIEVAPGIVTPGRYNPKPILDTMGFPDDFSGKSVLDIGCYDGFFSFEAERRGAARVLGIDRHAADWKGFETARQILGSKVEYRNMSVYDVSPETVGTFDIVLFPGVFYHLRHPLLALDRIHSVCKELLFLETHILDQFFVHDGKHTPLKDLNPVFSSTPVLQFYPNDELNGDLSNWFAPNAKCLEVMVAGSGFRPRWVKTFGYRASLLADREEFEIPHWY